MYNKLFTKILDSSIWLEPDATRIVWLTLIAAMDEDGFCQFSAEENLRSRARVTIQQLHKALHTLTSPDPESGNPEHEGRRIDRVPGGYIVLNAPFYRDVVKREHALELNRERVRRCRAKKSEAVTVCNDVKRNVTQSEQIRSDADQKKRGAKESRPTLSDSDWLESLKKDQTYAGIDVQREYGKMSAWCATNRKQPTRRRFVNWLNRCERPMSATKPNGKSPYGNSYPPPKPPMPTREELERERQIIQEASSEFRKQMHR